MTVRFPRSRFTLDAASLSGLYGAHAKRMLVYFSRRVLDVETAADLTAETFAQAFSDRRQFRGRTEEEAIGWLYGIARHQLSHYFRSGHAERRAMTRLGVDRPQLEDDEIARIEELAGVAELRGRVALVMDGLSAEQHEVLRMRVVEERSYEEIALATGQSEQTVRARVSRGLKALAAQVGEPTEMEEVV